MSQENVEIVRRTMEAYVVGDREAFFDFMAEDIEICPDVSRWPQAEPFRGLEEYRQVPNPKGDCVQKPCREGVRDDPPGAAPWTCA